MYRFLRALVLVACLALSPLFAIIAGAAEIRCVFRSPSGSSICLEALLTGPIEKGDYEKVSSFYATNHPWLNGFALLSPGGNVVEAIRIGRLFRRYFLGARAPILHGEHATLFDLSGKVLICQGASCVCASSCALIWYGAPARWGEVGLHRPRFKETEFAQLSPAEAEKIYKPSLDLIARYLEEMEAPKTAIEAMIATSSAEIQWIDFPDTYSPSFAEWIEASCGQYGTSEDRKKAIELTVRRYKSIYFPNLYANLALTETEQRLLNSLNEKKDAREMCVAVITTKNREKLTPPDLKRDRY